MSKRVALLVGADEYLTGLAGQARKHLDGSNVSLTNLRGTTNDVTIIQSILHEDYKFDDFTTLTSPPKPKTPQISAESDGGLPTHTNIKKAFNDIYQQLKPGDVFLFFFAGHGATLNTTENSPKDGRTTDPSLMTVDYCRGEPAIRGWELNRWLEKFNDKNVRVVVILDSCFSGGAWRGDGPVRTPPDWTPPPNLPADESVLQGTQSKPGHRDGHLEVSWDINPEDFTVMAACESTQKAEEKAEKRDTGASFYGGFTLAIKEYLQLQKSSSLSRPTYRTVRDGTAGLLKSWGILQEPQTFGQDRLAFLEGFEPTLPTPIIGTIQEDCVLLPVGKIHAISKGTEYITTSEPEVIVSIFEVNEYESRARANDLTGQQSRFVEFSPYRWGTEQTLEVLLDPDLGQNFQMDLQKELEKRIAGEIKCSESRAIAGNQNSGGPWFRLEKSSSNGIKIFGPNALVGNDEPVRGWKTTGEGPKDSAIALGHLFRFGQVLEVPDGSDDTPPFEIDVLATDNKFQHKLKSLAEEELHYAVFILSGGYHIRQLFPKEDKLKEVRREGRRSFNFELEISGELKRRNLVKGEDKYRDIVRTVVIEGQNISLKSTELPDIWNADQWDEVRPGGPGRDGRALENFKWWIEDFDVTLTESGTPVVSRRKRDRPQ